MSTIHYTEYAPHPVLQAHINSYWCFRVADSHPAPFTHHVMPDGCTSVIYFHRPAIGAQGMRVLGPRVEVLKVPAFPGEVVWGIRLHPDSTEAVLGSPPAAWFDQVLVVLAVHPQWGQALYDTLQPCADFDEAAMRLDQWLLPQQAHWAAPDAAIRGSIGTIQQKQGDVRVSELAAGVAMSARQLQRRFRQATGLTPKQYARIRRFRTSLAALLEAEPPSWAAVAADFGFADQAHLIREYAGFVGLTPTSFHERIAQIAHENVTP